MIPQLIQFTFEAAKLALQPHLTAPKEHHIQKHRSKNN